MAGTVLTEPCVVFALRWEARVFLRRYVPCHDFDDAPCRLYRCRRGSSTILMAEIGVGSRGATHLDWLVGLPVLEGAVYRPRFVLSAGFSGALWGEYAVGDVLLATEVMDLDGHVWPTTWPGAHVQTPFPRARLLSSPSLVGVPEIKQALGKAYQADAVDMETAAIVRRCAAQRVPCGCIRAISDDLQTRLAPQLVEFFNSGRLSMRRLLWQLLRRPRLIPEIARMGRAVRVASEHLGDALVSLLAPVP